MSKFNPNRKPYYDDFNELKKYYQILFRPERPVQARELNSIQSLFQSQLKKVTSYLLEDGMQLQGGQLSYSLKSDYVKIASVKNSTDFAQYRNKILTGDITGVEGQIIWTENSTVSDSITFFVKYLTSGRNTVLELSTLSGTFVNDQEVSGQTTGSIGTVLDNSGNFLRLRRTNNLSFSVGEIIESSTGEATIVSITDYNGTKQTFLEGETIRDSSNYAIVSTATNTIGVGSLAFIDEGVYFADGFLVNVDKQTIFLDKYSNIPSYKIGLGIQYSIVDYNQDQTLLDNAQGSSNFKGFGADRLKVDLVLSKLSLDSEDSIDFIELLRLKEGKIQQNNKTLNKPVLSSKLAQRTYDTNGNFFVKPFQIEIRESLNTNIDSQGNKGIYSGEAGGDGSYLAVGIEPGKAYVDGYECENTEKIYIDVPKARNFETQTGTVAQRQTQIGNYILATGVYKLPQFNCETQVEQIYPLVDLIDDDINTIAGTGSNFVSGLTTTKLVLADSSKAFDNVYTGGILQIYEGSGKGQVRDIEKYYLANNTCQVSTSFTGLDSTSKYSIIGKVTGDNSLYGGSKIGTAKIRDIVLESGEHGLTGIYRIYLFDIQMNQGKTFDLVKSMAMNQSDSNNIPQDFRCNVLEKITVKDFSGLNFSKDRTKNLLQITKNDGSGTFIYGFVFDWNSSAKQLLIQNLSGLYVASDSFNMALKPGDIINEKLYSIQVPSSTVPFLSVENTGASATISYVEKLFDTNNNKLLWEIPNTPVKSISNVTITNTKRTFKKTTIGQQVTFQLDDNKIFSGSIGDLTETTLDADYIVSLESSDGDFGILNSVDYSISKLSEDKIRVTIPFASSGDTVTLTTSILKTNTRVKTKSISETVIETIEDQQDVQLNKIILQNADIYQLFSVTVSGSTSWGSYSSTNEVDITDSYQLDNGQRDNVYELGQIVLKTGKRQPNAPIRIKYKYWIHGDGDYFSRESYPTASINYENIPVYISTVSGTKYRLSDCYDFRPKMDSNGKFQKIYGASQIDLPTLNCEVYADSISYYLNRIDKIYITSKGEFKLLQGTPAVNPTQPPDPSSGMVLYILNLKAFTYSTSEVIPTFIEHKRYTMVDIANLEKRIEKLENLTSLSMLEKETAATSITDSNNQERYKNGFIVDDFSTHKIGDTTHPDYNCAIDSAKGELRPQFNSRCVSLEFSRDDSTGIEDSDYAITGDLISLPYTETSLIKQNFYNNNVSINSNSSYNYFGIVKLNPQTDFWKDTNQKPEILVNNLGVFNAIKYSSNPQNFFGSLYKEWEDNWFGVDINKDSLYSQILTDQGINWLENSITTLAKSITPVDLQNTKTAIRSQLVSDGVRIVQSGKVLTINYIPYIRKSTINFSAQGMKPNTKLYCFFDGIQVNTSSTLYTNSLGECSGIFSYNPSTSDYIFRCGKKSFVLTNSSTNSSNFTTKAETTYTVAGLLETDNSTRPSDRDNNSTIRTNFGQDGDSFGTYLNPLAQTFIIEEDGGCFVSSVNLFFVEMQTKPTQPVIIEIRTVENGIPSKNIVPFSQKCIASSEINATLQSDGIYRIDPTTITFDSIVYLKENTEYCIVIKTESPDWRMWTARIGQIGHDTNATTYSTGFSISKPSFINQLFKPENTVSVGDSNECLTFELFKCVFNTEKQPEICFVNSVTEQENLQAQPFYTTKDSSYVRVYHKNHGFNNNDKVVISNITASQNGIDYSNLNSTFNVSDCEIDSYIILSENGQKATSTGFGQIASTSNVTASFNSSMNSGYFYVQQLLPSDTNINYSIKTMNSDYILDDRYSNIGINSTIDFNDQKLITLNQDGMTSDYSVYLRAKLLSDNPNVSPIIDTERIGVIAIQNRITNRKYSDLLNDITIDQTVKISNEEPFASYINIAGDTVWQSSDISFSKKANVDLSRAVITSIFTPAFEVSQPTSNASGIVELWDDVNKVLVINNISNSFIVGDGNFDYLKQYFTSGNMIFQCYANNVTSINCFGTLTTSNLTEDFLTKYNVGEKIDIISNGTKPNHIQNATVTNVSSNVLVTSYGNQTIGSIITATEEQSGIVSIENRSRENYLWSSNANCVVALKTIEPNKYLQIDYTNQSQNRGTFRVKRVDSVTGNVYLDCYLTNESSGSAIKLTQKENFIMDTSATSGSNKSSYVTKQVTLREPADSLKTTLLANVPTEGVIDVYYKIQEPNSTINFEQIEWTAFNAVKSYDNFDPDYIFGDSDEFVSEDEQAIFKQYNYTATDLKEFISFAIKIVSRSTNSSKVPRIKDFRCIATS